MTTTPVHVTGVEELLYQSNIQIDKHTSFVLP